MGAPAMFRRLAAVCHFVDFLVKFTSPACFAQGRGGATPVFAKYSSILGQFEKTIPQGLVPACSSASFVVRLKLCLSRRILTDPLRTQSTQPPTNYPDEFEFEITLRGLRGALDRQSGDRSARGRGRDLTLDIRGRRRGLRKRLQAT
jgi:hypothetical protein